MAKNKESQVIIDIVLNNKQLTQGIADTRKRLDELKIAQMGLRAEQKAGAITTEEFDKQNVALSAAIRDCNRTISAYNKEIDNNVKAYRAAEGSLDKYKANISNLTKEYNALSKAEREGAKGRELINKINEQKTALNKANEDILNFQHNVGNYPSAFQASEESITRFADILNKVFGGKIGQAATVVQGFAKGLNDLAQKGSESADSVTDSLGKINDVVSETNTSVNDLKDGTAVVQGFGKALYQTGENVSETGEKVAKSGESFKAAGKGATGLGKGFSAAANGAKMLGVQLLKLLKNPVVLIIAAIGAAIAVVVKAFKTFTDAIKNNDTAMTNFQRVVANLRPILDLLKGALNAVANVAGKVFGVIADGLGWIWDKIEFLFPRLKQIADNNEAVVVMTDELEEQERQYAVARAKREKEISDLRSKAAQKDKYSFDQRKQFLQQAIDLENQNLEEERVIASKRLEIRQKQAIQELGISKEYAELTKEEYDRLSDETKNQLSELEKALYDIEKNSANRKRELLTQQSEFTLSDKREKEAAAKAARERAKAAADAELSERRKLEDEVLKMIQSSNAKEIVEYQINEQRKIDDLRKRLKTEANLTINAKKAINAQIVLLESQLAVKVSEMLKANDLKRLEEDYNNRKDYYSKLMSTVGVDTSASVVAQTELLKLEEQNAQRVNDVWIEGYRKRYEEFVKVGKLEGEARKVALAALGTTEEKYVEDMERYYIELQGYEADYNNKRLLNEKYYQQQREKLTREHNQKIEDIEKRTTENYENTALQDELRRFADNEYQKAVIMQQAAEKRVKIAKEEYSELEDLRKKHTDAELALMFGSVEGYELALSESFVAVSQAENAVEDAIKAVAVAQTNTKVQMLEGTSAVLNSIGSLSSSFEGLFNKLAESDEKYADYATGLALMQILTSSAVSMASAIQGAMASASATGAAAVFTAPAFIAEMLAIVGSAITSATTTLLEAKAAKKSAPKFNTGGYVSGEKGVDKINAWLSDGEFVIRKKIVDKYGIEFFRMLNEERFQSIGNHFANGGVISRQYITNQNDERTMEQMREMFREVFKEIQPVVSVVEITKKQNRVKVKERISKQ